MDLTTILGWQDSIQQNSSYNLKTWESLMAIKLDGKWITAKLHKDTICSCRHPLLSSFCVLCILRFVIVFVFVIVLDFVLVLVLVFNFVLVLVCVRMII